MEFYPSPSTLLSLVGTRTEAEFTEDLLTDGHCRIERIVSWGDVTPDGEWYDQSWDEWVVVLHGSADVTVEDLGTIHLNAGDAYLFPAHCRHRVEWTAQPTIWLACHLGESQPTL